MAYRNQIRQLGLATLILLAFACGCAGSARYQRRSVIFFDYFDTAIQFIAEVKSEEEFLRYAKQAEDRFQELHRLFNIYESYPDLINLCTINTNAGGEALAVSPEIIALLQLAREGYRLSGGLLDVTLGPLLRIWHDLRQEALQNPDRAVLPQGAELREALALGGFENLQIDEDACLVCLTKPGMSLDVGALAKGYATELVAHELFASGLQNFLLDAGGNIRTMGKPLSTDKLRWSVGLQNPQSGTGDNFNPVID
ncbi:MAG: FAD:protein FMN transferase, partial [Symbiobacteriaceae bacterium]|nr:FAD:protein FMN transferase [Symbiobacteriaceae bacterium]